MDPDTKTAIRAILHALEDIRSGSASAFESELIILRGILLQQEDPNHE